MRAAVASLAARLGLDVPIIQAPMAGVQDGALALAVCGAGGLGSLPCALLSRDAMVAELSTLRSSTSKPYNVNFFCHAMPAADAARELAWQRRLAPYYKELAVEPNAVGGGSGRAAFDADAAEIVSEFKPAVVSFHFGLPPAALLARIKTWRPLIVSSATTVDEARWLEARGVDAIVAQGFEAGGHRGMFLTDDLTTQSGTFALLPQIVRAVRVPVIAAGGIADADGVAAALQLGAAAVQVGTAYLLCPEATTSAVHRAALKSDAARHTAVTNVFTGRPARAIVNRFVAEVGPMSADVPAFPRATAAVLPLRASAESHGSPDFSPLWSGQNPTGCREIPAAALTRELTARL
jgi:nitronate monooxygenase